MKNVEKVLWVVGAAGFLLGIVGLVQRVGGGHMDAGYGTNVPWGLWVAMYAMMVGMSAGAFIFAAVTYAFGLRSLFPAARIALPVALATFVGGMLAIWLDLGHPFRVWKLWLSTGFSSVMGWMAWFYLAYFVVLCLLLWLAVVRRQAEGGTVRALGWAGISLALIFGGGEGALFGVVGARPFWHSGLTPILFIVEGLLSGVALVALAGLLLSDMDERLTATLGRLVLGLLAVAILFEWAEISIGYYASVPAYAESLKLVLFGQFSWVFWGLHVGLGILLPLVLLAAAGRSKGAVALASGLIAFTAISTKLNVVIPGLAVPEMQGLKDAYVGPGLSFEYFPTTMEWFVALWIVASAALVFLASYRVLARLSAIVEYRVGAARPSSTST